MSESGQGPGSVTAMEPQPSGGPVGLQPGAGPGAPRLRRLVRGLVAVAAVIAQVALLFLYGFAPGMIAGAVWAYAFLFVWAIELIVTLYLAVRRPLAAPLVPAISLVIAVVALGLGTNLLGWTG